MKELYFDLRIKDKNFVLDSGAEPELCNNRDSIAQDVVHMIIESVLAKSLVGERSIVRRYDVLQQMELLVESDDRIVPGTVNISDSTTGNHTITADTWDFGPISRETGDE
ncbi:DUF2590 domain-containing protein [Lelliottia sp. WB101]|uniref:DUF2590 family protein n=1 Tax=Lelliottia sp. WB101 TaxID=2153385 RepID=UPI000D217500|nr:DUF2590 family protein [Lelliottia sp. WB101]AVY99394.1 DUF2590 domain-containing protein [Lelliottia sp. WB101]